LPEKCAMRKTTINQGLAKCYKKQGYQ